MAKVPIGATLEWADDPSITCTVVDQKNQVKYEGEPDTISISGLARKLKGSVSESGPRRWIYEGETLQERRERFEREEANDDS